MYLNKGECLERIILRKKFYLYFQGLLFLQTFIYSPIFVVGICCYEATEMGVAAAVGFAIVAFYMIVRYYLGKYIGILRYDMTL